MSSLQSEWSGAMRDEAKQVVNILLAQETTGWVYNDSGKPIRSYRNPDGPTAADIIIR